MIKTMREFIPQSPAPAEMPAGIAVKYYIRLPGKAREITAKNCGKILKNLREGVWESIYLTNDPDLEQNFMQLESGDGLFALQYLRDNTGGTGEQAAWFSTYTREYLDSDEETEIRCSDGQSIIFRRFATDDRRAVTTALEYFIRTGELWDGLPWMKSWRELE